MNTDVTIELTEADCEFIAAYQQEVQTLTAQLAGKQEALARILNVHLRNQNLDSTVQYSGFELNVKQRKLTLKAPTTQELVPTNLVPGSKPGSQPN